MSDSGNDYSTEPALPDFVRRAAALAVRLSFRNSCAIPYGRLLHVLAAQRTAGDIGETGTGCGVGTAWMASAASKHSRIVTVEVDRERASAAAELFVDVPNVTVLHANWKVLMDYGPFDLLFLDGGGKREDQEVALSMVRQGGTVVLDDLTPGRAGPDQVRDWWLNSASVRAIEVALTREHAAILAVRR